MPEKKTERVEFLLESKLGDVRGIRTVLHMLREVETRIGRINAKTVSPQGFAASSTNAATNAIRRQTTAVEAQASAEERLAKIRRTTRPPGKGGGGSLELTKDIGVGRKKIEKFGSTTAHPKTLESTTLVTDFDKIRKAQEDADKLRRQELDRRAQMRKKLHDAHQKELAERERQAQAEQRHADQVRNRQKKAMDRARKEHDAPMNRLKNSVGRLSPIGLLGNVAHFGGWAIAVGSMYKMLQLATASMTTMINVGYQTARLSQVFHGVGGSAQELTDDVLKLAAANGRSTDEAMESAIAWSRLGLTRKEINEAVRVSLIAANVAEIDAGQATKNLSSLMAVYGLRVGQLNSVLGMLNNTSNNFNVTNKDMLDGLARSAAVAKNAGMGLAELQGLIGATVGRTGNTGSQVGNAIKSIFTAIGNPDIQDFLREQMNFEVTAEGGQGMKDMSAIMAELFVRWQSLTTAERNNLTVKVAMKTQANRFVAMMDSYVTAQKLAISSQENLTSAEDENNKILATQKSSLQSIRAEWDRLVVKQANAKDLFGGSANTSLVTYMQGLRTIIGLLNQASSIGGKIRSFTPLGVLMGIGSSVNKHVWSPVRRMLDPEGSRMDATSKAIEEFGNKAEAAGRKAQLLKSVKSVMGGPGGDKFLNQVKGLMGGKNIDEAIAQAEADAVANKQKYSELTSQAADSIDRQIAKLEEEGGKDVEINNLLRQKNGLMGQTLELMEEMTEAQAEFDSNTQRRLNVLERQRAVLEGIAGLFTQLPQGNLVSSLSGRAAALGQQIAFLKSSLAEVEKSPEFATVKGREQISEMRQQLRALRSELSAVQSPAVMGFAQQMMKDSVTMRSSDLDMMGAGVGQNEAERLLNQERFLRGRLGTPITGTGDTARNASVSQQKDLSNLMDTLIRKDEMINRLHVERVNLLEEQKKIYQESLLMAGPGDFLRKLAVKGMVDRGGGRVGLGDFLALGEAAKRDVADYTGMFQKRSIDRQLGILGPRRTRDQMEQDEFTSATHMGKLHDNLISPAAREASAALGAMGPVVTMVNSQLKAFGDQLYTVMNNLAGGMPMNSPGPHHPIHDSVQGGMVK